MTISPPPSDRQVYYADEPMQERMLRIRVIVAHVRAAFRKVDPQFHGIGSKPGVGYWWNNYA